MANHAANASEGSDTSSVSSARPVDLDAAGADGWEDAESDDENVEYRSLFDDKCFSNLTDMLLYCKKEYGTDLKAVVGDLGLDFYGCIKLVNYIRFCVKQGDLKPNLQDPNAWADDKYLQPVLEDDAVLFQLDDVLSTQEKQAAEVPTSVTGSQSTQESVPARNIGARAPQRLLRGEEYLAKLMKESGMSDKRLETDADYFDSYAYNDIHETMLKDEVRTAAYRDFIYDYKHLFKDKTVLDIGCGTGILSMFAAKAGAKRVFAVDNSNIITKAKQIISDNHLEQIISCVRGMVETIDLPWKMDDDTSSGNATHADIIVSEWMGYCLLYEAMLDSVLWARDRYLNPVDGLMVPSHCTLHIAPFTDPEYLEDSIGFWNGVYGFDMRAMTESIYDDVVVRSVKPDNLAAPSAIFKALPLHTITTSDLDFYESVELVLGRDIDAFDGWVIWFDTFMLPRRGDRLPDDARAEAWNQSIPGAGNGVGFTTGPHGTETHWKAGLLLIDHAKKQQTSGKAVALSKGQRLKAQVRYRKNPKYVRGLEVTITWDAEGTHEKGSQIWSMK